MSYPMVGPNVYAVFFREARLMKVGHSRGERWRSWVARGAELVGAYGLDTIEEARAVEKRVHAVLASQFEAGFSSADEARAFTGIVAGGWTEFYRIPAPVEPSDLIEQIRMADNSAITETNQLCAS